MTARTVPAAASAWVAEHLGGTRRPVDVVARGAHAVYVDVDGDCVGVLARDATAVPIGLRTTLDRLPDVGETVGIGDGRVWFDEYAVAVTRIVDARVPRLGELSAATRPLTRIAADNSARTLGLPAAALRALAAAEALELLGRGDGLTPAGDDVLAGWLVARHAIGRSSGAVAEAVATHAAGRTTLLSATLLRRAIAGEALPECRELLLALRADAGVDAARDRLLAVGHTSGAALAVGISLGLEDAR